MAMKFVYFNRYNLNQFKYHINSSDNIKNILEIINENKPIKIIVKK